MLIVESAVLAEREAGGEDEAAEREVAGDAETFVVARERELVRLRSWL